MKNENKEIVKQYIENILNTGNAEKLSSLISPQYTEFLNRRKYRLGIRGIQKKIAGIRMIYPDLKLSIDTQITEGDWVITSYVMNGTKLGSWMGVTPTGKSIEVRGVNMDRVVDGKITEHGSSTDLLDPFIDSTHSEQHSMRWVKDNLQNGFLAKKKDADVFCESEIA
jgi:predicted ester cyclase